MGGISLPPSLFLLQCRKNFIYEGDKGEQILEEPLWPQRHGFDKCPMFRKKTRLNLELFLSKQLDSKTQVLVVMLLRFCSFI